VSAGRSALATAVYDMPSTVSPIAISERQGFDLASTGDYPAAARELGHAAANCTDPGLRGWLRQRRATYLNFTDKVSAQEEQRRALADNRTLLRPIGGTTYQRIGDSTLTQADRCRELVLTHHGGLDLLIDVNGLLADLKWDLDNTEAFEAAMEKLGRFLGFQAQRPEKTTGRGPDVLWALGGLHFAVIECKSGSNSKVIFKKDAAQLSTAIDWFIQQYDDSCHPTPVMVHPSNVLDRAATARAGTCIIDVAKLQQLTDRVLQFAKSIAGDNQGSRWPSAAEIAQRLQAHDLAGQAVFNFTVEAKSAK
jgi:hypothetical protein